jgi:peptide deformylase
MAVRNILKMGNPALRKVAASAAKLGAEETGAIIIDLLETMAAHDGAGLAAPQIGIPYRIVAFGMEKNPRYPDAEPVPWTVLIDPVIKPLDDAMVDGWEGCLSVPGMRGMVPRFGRIVYSGILQSGERIVREATGFHARLVQHECDHLDGVLYPDRIVNRRMFGFIGELQAVGLIGDVAEG